MPRDPISFANFEEAFAGGVVFNEGMYRIERSRFTYFDFNKPGKDRLCLMLELQSVVDGKDVGDPTPQYWGVMDQDKEGNKTVEPCSPVKGEKGLFWSQIRLTDFNPHDKLFKYSDFGVFMEQCHKLGKIDMDEIGNDISEFDGKVYEFGKQVQVQKAKTAIQEAEAGDKAAKDKAPREIIVIVGVPTEKKGHRASGKEEVKDKKAATKEEKGGKKVTKKSGPEELVIEYLEEEVCTKDNEDGTPFLVHAMGLRKWLKGKDTDEEQVGEALATYNDKEQLAALLTANGWELEGKVIKKTE